MKRCLNPYAPAEQVGVFFGCGKCLPCKLQRRAEWSLRMLHEYTMSEHTCFITLTYDDRHLMRSASLITHAGTLSKHHFQTFMKRLRRRMTRDGLPGKVRFYACGEYGDLTLRPHYHAILFGVSVQYLKPRINEIWHHGTRNDVSVVTEGRIQYVAGYIDKKLFGEKGERAYRDVEPPFQLCSLGLGVSFALANQDQMLYDAALAVGKAQKKIPRLYLEHIAKYRPDEVEGVRDRIYENARMFSLEKLLEEFPHFGGRSYEQLNAEEREEVARWLRTRNVVYFEDLVSRNKQKQKTGV
jgi:hypothetical protein